MQVAVAAADRRRGAGAPPEQVLPVDQADRRRVKLRMSEQGMTVARGFFTPLAEHAHHSMAELTDEDLRTAHRVFTALGEAMQRFLDELGHR